MPAIKYLPHSQLKLQLKLGREVAQFTGIDQYFGQPSFDWVLLSGNEQQARIRRLRSRDEGDSYYCDVMSFSLICDDDPEERLEYQATLEQCLHWLESELGGSAERFIGKGMIDMEYQNYAENRDT